MIADDDLEKRVLAKFGDTVRVLRRKSSLSQEELADRAGVHRTYIGMIERGEKNVTILTLLRVSKALRVQISDITRGLTDGK